MQRLVDLAMVEGSLDALELAGLPMLWFRNIMRICTSRGLIPVRQTYPRTENFETLATTRPRRYRASLTLHRMQNCSRLSTCPYYSIHAPCPLYVSLGHMPPVVPFCHSLVLQACLLLCVCPSLTNSFDSLQFVWFFPYV